MRRRFIAALVAALLLLSAITPAAQAAATKCVTFYENINGGGAKLTICNLNSSNLGAYGWNDRASSILITNASSSNKVRFYPDTGYDDNGVNLFRVITVSGNDYLPDLRNYWANDFDGGMNDKISSFKWLQ